MFLLRKLYLSILFISYLTSMVVAQEDGGKQLRNNRKNPRIKTRISISPVLGIYTPNKKHTTNARQKMAFCFSIKEEIRLDKKNREFLMLGIDYVLHGVNFNSYYFYKDSLKLYTGKMNYKYNVTIHEIDFPIQFKHSLKKETNAIYTNYLFAGYCYRWIVASKLVVEDNGNEIISQQQRLTFKSPVLTQVNNSFFSAGFGIQKNQPLKYRAVYAELQIRYGLSPFYINETFAPSSLYINGHFVYLTMGVKI